MADVSREGRPASERDRGQLILVTALALAILFVSLALIVNTAIYTENLATRGSDIGGGTEAVRYHETVSSGVGGAIEYANLHENASHTSLQNELRPAVDAIDNRTGMSFALSDRAVTVTLDDTVNGSRVAQTATDRNFSSTDGDPTWTMAEDVDRTRAFVINVTDETYLEEPNTGDEFQMILEDGGGSQWILNVTSDGSTAVGVTNSTGSSTCSANEEPIINVSGGTIDGNVCEGLILAEDLTPPYDIRIVNGDSINGTYSLVVTNKTLTGDSPHLNDGHSPSQPFTTDAIYSADITAVYQSPQLYYNVTVRVAPGEAGNE